MRRATIATPWTAECSTCRFTASRLTVPIRPALRVSQPVAFAVTLEPVGGVVVSDRSHLMALARAGGH